MGRGMGIGEASDRSWWRCVQALPRLLSGDEGVKMLDELEPRLRTMVLLILRNRDAICEPVQGTLEIHFRGKRVSAKLLAPKMLAIGDDEWCPPPAS